jgi:hypothetical protein
MKNETNLRINESNSPTNKLKLTFSHIKKFSSDYRKEKSSSRPKDYNTTLEKPIKSIRYFI